LNEGPPIGDGDSMMPAQLQRRNALEAFGLLGFTRGAVSE
jgi:hypothetical protein